jgi:hypothetical protein
MIERSKDILSGPAAGVALVPREPLPPACMPSFFGGAMPSDEELLGRTLAFSGTSVSDDGTVTIRRSSMDSVEYSGDRFVGNCTICSRALLIPAKGEPLTDVKAAFRFMSAHHHGDVD